MENTEIFNINSKNSIPSINKSLRRKYPAIETAYRSLAATNTGSIILENLKDEYKKLIKNKLWKINILDAIYLGDKENKIAMILYWLYSTLIIGEPDKSTTNFIMSDTEVFEEFSAIDYMK